MQNNFLTSRFFLLNNGYYIGDLKEIIDNEEEFSQYANKVKFCFHNNLHHFQYRNVVRMHPEYSMHVSIQDIAERRRLIEENKYSIGQQWYESLGSGEEIYSSQQYFQKIIKKIIPNFYPELSLEKNNFRFNDTFTVFSSGDFIEPHRDGLNLGRLCVILIYLSEESEYNNSGGVFRIPEKNVELLPVKGKYAVLDFTQHNLKHEVTTVKEGFYRFTYNSFVYNTDKERS